MSSKSFLSQKLRNKGRKEGRRKGREGGRKKDGKEREYLCILRIITMNYIEFALFVLIPH